MPPREVIRLGNLEKTLILANYRQNGAMWDVIINEISRNPQFAQLLGNLQDMYRNVGPSKCFTKADLRVYSQGTEAVSILYRFIRLNSAS